MKSTGIYLASLMFFTLSVFGQKPSGTTTFYPAKPRPGVVPGPTMMQMPLVVPLFLVGDRFASVLTLVNNSTADTYADVTFRGLDGRTLASQRVEFAHHSQRLVDVGSLLQSKGLGATKGSIVVAQSPSLAGPTIAATLAMTYRGTSNPNFIDEEISMPSMEGSQVLQGVADRAHGSPLVAISSMAESMQHITMVCLGEHGANGAHHIDLAAGATFLADCTGSDESGHDFATAAEDRDEAASGPVGIKLTSDAMPGSFAAFALAPHRSGYNRFFSSILFSDPKLFHSPNTVFTGIPVGFSSLLGGNYTPHLSVSNFSATEVHVHTTFAQTSGNAPASGEVGALTVPAGSSRELILKNLEGDPGLQNSFIVTSDGDPGALMAKLISQSDSSPQGVELQAKDELDDHNAGEHPWSLEQGTESTLLLFNHGDKPQFFNVSLGGSATWQKAYKLAPMQTLAIGIQALIDNQVKDDKGRVLPKTLQSGELNWEAPSATRSSGRLLQSSRTTGMARNFSCGYAGLLCGADLSFLTEYLPDGSVVDFGLVTTRTCTSGNIYDCSGQQTGSGDSGFSYDWSSRDTGIASISGGSTMPNSSLLGVSVGSTYVNGNVNSQYCSAGGGGPATVTVPSKLLVAYDPGNVQANNCAVTSQNGKVRNIQYQLADGGGHNLGQSLIEEVYENLSANTCGNGVPQATTCTSSGAPNGIFTDVIWTNYCSPTPSNSCGFSIQPTHWKSCATATHTNIGSPTYIVTWRDITVNGAEQIVTGQVIP